jgi:hypothetical protein
MPLAHYGAGKLRLPGIFGNPGLFKRALSNRQPV